MPPQHYLLNVLATLLPSSTRSPDQTKRIEEISRSRFGSLTFDPTRVGVDEHGRTILAYPGDESRGGMKGQRHRSSIVLGKAGVRRFHNFC
jgi:hypothetical protein